MLRIAIRRFVLGAFASLAIMTASAQLPKPATQALQDSQLNNALDRLEPRLEKRLIKPAGPPQPGDIMVNCSLPDTPVASINAALARLNPTRVNTIRVSGTCHENVVIQGFENLTLIAHSSASINDASGGNLPVFEVGDTHEFSLQGFIVNGGATGVTCADNSLCRFSGNTIQGSARDGIVISRSQATLQGDTLQNGAGLGLAVLNGAIALAIDVTTQGNGSYGTIVNAGSNLTTSNLISRNNGLAGIRLANHSTLRLDDSTVTGNSGQGVSLDSSSEATFETIATGNVITGNGFAGVRLGDLSFVFFAGTDNITGNQLANPGGLDVVCAPQFSATRGALTNIGGGTTNCLEP